ncbi:MAG: hypothetical protein V7L01_14665 [Nostoc sp.]|uniref:hypothetical protein n=1 Tax=Nostoc sp. TaxID=1180 RepID=UPI002FFBAE83
MITIAKRVKSAIDHWEKGEIELALTDACIAVDATSIRYYQLPKSSWKEYQRFLKEFMWLITYSGLPGLMSQNVEIPRGKLSLPGVIGDTVSVEQLIYYVLRCDLVHGNSIDSNLVFSNHVTLGNDGDKLLISSNIVWGILHSVIFNPANANEKIGEEFYWTSITDFKMFIDDYWGKIHIPKKIIQFYTGVVV